MAAKRTSRKPSASRRPAKKRVKKRVAKIPASRRPATPLLELVATWPFVSRKYMFGCNALLGKGRLFFIEMDESIVLRVGQDQLSRALRVRGSEIWNPWTPGEPGDWVSFPPSRRQIPKPLAGWARTAYEAALKRKAAPKKRARASKSAGRRAALRGR